MIFSTSNDNNYKIADFNPVYTGIYTIRIHRVYCRYDDTYLGWAWWSGK